MTKISLFIATTCMVLATESGSLANMVQSIDTNATQKEQNVTNPHKTKNNNPFYQGEVMTVEQGGSYTYLEVKEQTGKTFWVAVNAVDAKIGDYVRFQMELVTKNFKSKALNRTFKELMFASSLEKRTLQPQSKDDPKIKTH